MTDAIVNPITGELVDADDLDALLNMRDGIDAYLDRLRAETRAELRPYYEARDKVLGRVAELRGVKHVSSVPRRYRSDAQAKTFKCPNCARLVEV